MKQGAATLCSSLCYTVAHFLWLRKAIWGKQREDNAGPLGLAFQKNSSNSLVLVPCRQLGNISSVLGRSMLPKPNIFQMVDTFPHVGYSLRPMTVCCMEYLVPIHISDASRKIMSGWDKSYGLQDGHQENASHKSHRHRCTSEGTGRHMCLCNT